MCLRSPPNHSRIGVLAFGFFFFFRYSVENFSLRLPLDSFPGHLSLLHYSEIMGRLQLGAGLVHLSLSDLIVNG